MTLIASTAANPQVVSLEEIASFKNILKSDNTQATKVLHFTEQLHQLRCLDRFKTVIANLGSSSAAEQSAKDSNWAIEMQVAGSSDQGIRMRVGICFPERPNETYKKIKAAVFPLFSRDTSYPQAYQRAPYVVTQLIAEYMQDVRFVDEKQIRGKITAIISDFLSDLADLVEIVANYVNLELFASDIYVSGQYRLQSDRALDNGRMWTGKVSTIGTTKCPTALPDIINSSAPIQGQKVVIPPSTRLESHSFIVLYPKQNENSTLSLFPRVRPEPYIYDRVTEGYLSQGAGRNKPSIVFFTDAEGQARLVETGRFDAGWVCHTGDRIRLVFANLKTTSDMAASRYARTGTDINTPFSGLCITNQTEQNSAFHERERTAPTGVLVHINPVAFEMPRTEAEIVPCIEKLITQIRTIAAQIGS